MYDAIVVGARVAGSPTAMFATGGPRIRRWSFDVGPFALSGNPLPAGDIDFDLCPRRTVLSRRSRIARLVDAPTYNARASLTVGYHNSRGYRRQYDADLLAAALDAGWSGRQPLDEALATYEQTRNAAVMPMYEFTYKLAQLEAPSEQEQRLFGALRSNRHEAERFLSLIAGSVSIPEFFAEENVGRIIRKAQATTLPAEPHGQLELASPLRA